MSRARSRSASVKPDERLPQNYILQSLSAEARARIYPHLKLTPVSAGAVLCECGHRMRHIYFPTSTMVSLVHVLESGASAEVAVVGNEGAVGVSLFMGGETTTTRAVVQNTGYAYRLSGARLKREFERHEELYRLLLRYAQSLITQMSQTAVCNRHHSIDQQLCRWLLLSLDRLGTNELVMTHELIANMLGVRREGITDAAGRLQRRGIIRYKRGQIAVLARAELERLCCECYRAVQKETDRLRRMR
jgi:CRP-like cAMP-binding protein